MHAITSDQVLSFAMSTQESTSLTLWLQAKTILIATGGRAVKLPVDGAEHAIISDEVLNLPSLPKKMAVIGGGYIGLEFAGIYNNYGSEVHVVYRQVRLSSSSRSTHDTDRTCACSRCLANSCSTSRHSFAHLTSKPSLTGPFTLVFP